MPDDLAQRTGDLEHEIETLRRERDEARALLAAARTLLGTQARLLTQAHTEINRLCSRHPHASGRYHLTDKAHTAINQEGPA